MTKRDYLTINKERMEHDDHITALRKLLLYHENQKEHLKNEIKSLQDVCNHNWRFLWVGRHGSDKDDKTFDCTICGIRKTE